MSVAGVSWAQHMLWAQATWGLSQLAVGAQLPWKNTDSLLSRKGLAGPGQEERAHHARRPGPGQWLWGAPRGLPTPASCPLVCCLEVRLHLKTSCCHGPVKTSSPLPSMRLATACPDSSLVSTHGQEKVSQMKDQSVRKEKPPQRNKSPGSSTFRPHLFLFPRKDLNPRS